MALSDKGLLGINYWPRTDRERFAFNTMRAQVPIFLVRTQFETELGLRARRDVAGRPRASARDEGPEPEFA